MASLAIAVAVVGCASDGGDVPIGTSESPLSASEAACANWTLVEKTLTGGGEFLSPASYNPAGCGLAYRVNLVDYDGVKYNGGAVVGYGGAIPTTAAACNGSIVRAYVWERGSDGVMRFINNKNVNGEWQTGLDGVGRCRLGVVNLERDVGIVPNGTRDYRVAITARTAANVTVPVAFATVEAHVVTPIDEVKNLVAYGSKLNGFSGANLEPFLKAAWDIRNTGAGQALCRRLDIDRGLHAFTRAALIKAGATTATVDSRNTELGNLRAALCTTAGTTTNLHNAIKNYVTHTLSVRTQIRNQLSSLMPGREATTLDGMAANMMAQLMFQGLGALVSKCDLNAGPLDRFLSHGTLPPGVTDPTRVVLGACGSQNPAQAASGIGFGTATPGVSNPVSAMASCMAELAATADETRCSNPRATGAPDASQEPTDVCWNGKTYKECNSILKAEHQELKRQMELDRKRTDAQMAELLTQAAPPAPAAPIEIAKNSGAQIALGISLSADMVKIAADAAALSPANTAPAKIVSLAASAVSWTAKLAAASGMADAFYDFFTGDAPARAPEDNLENWCESHPEDRQWCDRFTGSQDYCPADPLVRNAKLSRLADFVWYETGGPNAPRQSTKQDLFNHCLCNLVDSDYSAMTRGERPARAPAVSCPQSDEQRKLDCVADPRLRIGDDDRPDPKCIELLSPGVLDANTWRGKDCEQKLCPANQKPFVKSDGECVCSVISAVGGAFPDCLLSPRAATGMCTADAPEACFCEPIFPLAPNGNDPFCRLNPNVLPGPLSSWLTPDRDALYLHAFNGTTDVLRVRAGGNTQFASPLLYPNSFAVRGPTLRQKVVLYKAPGVGENVDLKLYYTNHSKNVIHSFLGQCRMNSFSVGALSNCDFPLPTINGVNAGNLEDAFQIDFESNTAVSYKTRIAVGPLGFTGTVFNTPAAKLAPNCPTPGTEIVGIKNPLPGILRIPLDPNPTYTLPSGSILEIRPFSPVIRDLR